MEAQQRYGDEVRFVGIPGRAGAEEIDEFIEAQGVDGFPHLDDSAGDLWERFGVTEQRTYVFVNDDGSVRRTGYDDLEGEIERLIQG